jgi:hypothetical protein
VSGSLARFTGYRFTRTLRRRAPGYVSVTLLVGLVGGLALASVAAARRTQSTFPSYLASADASDLQLTAYFSGGSPVANLYSPAFTDQLARLPSVRSVAGADEVFAVPLEKNGTPFLPPPLNNNEVNEVAPFNGLTYFGQDRVIADRGRVPDPTRADEFAATALAARQLHWHLGQTISFGIYSIPEVASSGIGAPTAPPVLTIRARLTGIVALDTAVVHDEVDTYPTFVIFTPALARRLVPLQAFGYTTYTLRLDGGARDVSAVEREVIGLLPSGTPYNFHVTSVGEGQVERATKPESIALGVFGAIAGLAALLVASQAVSRSLRTNRRDLQVLRAFGASRAMLVADALVGTLGAILAGGLLAVVLCVALSPLSPLGVVRQVDPSPGLNFDWTVLGGGFGVFVVGLSAIALALTLPMVHRRDAHDRASLTPEASRIVTAAASMGLPPASIAGIRFAIERGRGQDAVPVGSALLGAALAVAVVITTLTFGNGLTNLVSHPALYGWNWSYALQSVGNSQAVPPVATGALDKDTYVASWTGFNFADAEIDGQTVPIMITTSTAAFSPPILSGQSVHAGQIVLGGTTLAQVHAHVGGTVVVSYGSPKDAPVYVPPTRLVVAGTATFPAIGNSGTLHPSMGAGALILKSIEPPAMQRALTSPDPNLNGYDIVAVRMRNNVSAAAGLASLQRIADHASQVIENDPNSGGGTYAVLPVQQPAEIVNYKTMGATPVILATGLALGAAVALGLTLVASVRRRQRDLALLKTLGFAQRQLSAVVSWQASVAALVGIVVGVPLGIILGKTLWTLFAHQIFAVPRPAVPTLATLLAATGALVLANVVAFVPGRIAARTPIAVLLRRE